MAPAGGRDSSGVVHERSVVGATVALSTSARSGRSSRARATASPPLAAASDLGRRRQERPYTPPMPTFVFRLKGPRPNFALDMTEEEREIMGRHAAYWQPFIDSGQMVIFGPVLDGTGSWGLGVLEAEDEEEMRAFAAGDPVVVTGTAEIELGKMLTGFIRAREPSPP